jgi:hypothetical protein
VQVIFDNLQVDSRALLITTPAPEAFRLFNPSFEANNLTALGRTFVNRVRGSPRTPRVPLGVRSVCNPPPF